LAEPAGLQFEGTVTATSQGDAVRVTGEGERIVIELNRGAWRTLRRYARQSSNGSAGSSDPIGSLIKRAHAAIELRVDGRTLATAAPGQPGNWVGRLLGVEAFRVRPWALLTSLLG